MQLQADGPSDAEQAAREILGREFRGLVCRSVLVEEKLQNVTEVFIGVTYDGRSRRATLLGSTGGDLLKAYYAARESHHKKTEAVVTVFVDRLIGLFSMQSTNVAVGFIFRMILNEQYGPLDSVLRSLHLPNVLWLSSTSTAPYSIVLMDVWQWTPLMFLLLLAGLQSVPGDAIEAARIDGASGLRVVWDIILPLLAPISVMAIFLRMILAFTIFGQIYLLTGGGPGTATTSTTLLAYFQGFQNFNLSYGSTISLALLLFVTFTGLLYLSVTRLLLRRVAT